MENDVSTIFTCCASLRARSFTRMLLEVAETEIARLGLEVVRFDLDEIPHYNEDLDGENPPAIVKALRAAMSGANGLLIATPTFNGAVPGTLKDAVDWASRPFGKAAFRNRPYGVITASTGPSAGTASAEYLRFLELLGAKLVEPMVSIGKVTHSIDAENNVTADTARRVRSVAQGVVLAARGASVADNVAQSRFEITLNGNVAGYAEYIKRGDTLEIPHTVTDPGFRGQGIASVLVRALLLQIRADQKSVVPSCPFVADFILEHAEFADLTATG